MKFFNIDLHIGPISDIKKIFEDLGHTVDTLSISGHSWVLNKESDKNLVKVLTVDNWYDMDQKMCDEFYEAYKEDLKNYDGFIVTTVCPWIMFYERFNKPIIVHIPTRYDSILIKDLTQWNWFNDTFIRLYKEGKLFVVANNTYDVIYTKAYSNIEPIYIPSICEYTNAKWTPSLDKNFWVSSNKFLKLNLSGVRILDLFAQNIRYEWKDLYSTQGIAHFPYQVSTMSIFEQYTAGIPLAFPTKRFSKELYFESKILFREFSLKPHVLGHLKFDAPKPKFFDLDLNDHTSTNVFEIVLENCDFYNEEWMPAIHFFDSFQELGEIANGIKLLPLKNDNREFRKKYAYTEWKKILDSINIDI